MTMRRFLMDKLSRDKTIEKFQSEGVVAKYYLIEDDEEFLDALAAKIAEEFEEVLEAQTMEEVTEELGDLDEVLDEFKKFLKISQKDIDKARSEKAEKRGRFNKRIYCEYIDVPESATNTMKIVLDSPDKYPELDSNGLPLNEDGLEDCTDKDCNDCEFDD